MDPTAVYERGLAGLGAAGDQHVEPGDDGGLEQLNGMGGQRAQGDQLVEGVRCSRNVRRLTAG